MDVIFKENQKYEAILHEIEIKPKTKKVILETLNPEDKAAFTLYLLSKIKHRKIGAYGKEIFSKLIEKTLAFNETQLIQLFHLFLALNKESMFCGYSYSLSDNTKQLIWFLEKNNPTQIFIKEISTILKNQDFHKEGPYDASFRQTRQEILFAFDYVTTKQQFTLYAADDVDKLGQYFIQFINQQDKADAIIWHLFFNHCAAAKAGKPTQEWLKIGNTVIKALSSKKFKTLFLASVKTAITLPLNDPQERYNQTFYLADKNRDTLKGLLWLAVRFYDNPTLQLISQLCQRCFEKIPTVGALAAGLGNACIYTLAHSRGLDGIGQLSRLKLRIKQNNTQKLIAKYIEEQAKKRGLTSSQIEETAVSDFGLTLAERYETFDDYQLCLRLTGIGKTVLEWHKPDGKIQKSVPAFVKNTPKHSQHLKDIRNINKQVKVNSTAQRDRIDRLYTDDRTWTFTEMESHYFNHGLVCFIARRLIWSFKIDKQWIPAFWIKDQWLTLDGQDLKPNKNTAVRLWHPIYSPTKDVLKWRDFLEKEKIQQPIKQAYREIYLLTDAEIKTKSYSNRFAAHILKQHQFNALASIRGWKYSLLGYFDDSRDNEIAMKSLPAHQLIAQFWIDTLDDFESNEAGILTYIATDQVRFLNEQEEVVNLVDINDCLLSETLRDVDLFVGVASIGNDSQWRDNGGERQQNYWHEYSFGELSAMAKTRKQVLEKLVPRLKIKDIAKIEGKFLIIKGTRHNYKIHIGSGNILMSPNEKYLCIVAGRGRDSNLNHLFLPFEGDGLLSIILSKAFLLAADDKIKDKTILSQL